MSNRFLSQRPAWVFFITLSIMTALVMLKVELPLMLGWDPEWDRKIDAYRWTLHVHAIAGSIALFIAPLQFLLNLRAEKPQLHRLIGRIYALSICVAAPLAFWIALNHLSASEKWAACAQALLWLYATILAVVTAMRAQFSLHRTWICRSYGLTCTFVLTRFLVDVLHFKFSETLGGNAGLIISSSILVLIYSDLINTKPVMRVPQLR